VDLGGHHYARQVSQQLCEEEGDHAMDARNQAVTSHSDDCKIADKLAQVHDWAHTCLRAVNKEELHEAHDLGNEILELLNGKLATGNGIKFLALFEAIAVGADILNNEMARMQGASGRIN
jgi:hypothetical protein